MPSTPATATAKKTKTPATKSTTTKRKKPVITASDSEDNTSAPPTKTPAKRRKHTAAGASDEDADMKAEMADLGVRIKDEPIDDNDTPSKPARRGVTGKMPKYTESEEDAEEGGHPQEVHADNGSEDEYVDKEVVEKMSAYLNSPDDDEAEV